MMTDHKLGIESYEPPGKLFKTLMHPIRLAILDILRDGEECVCHMEAILGYRQAYISQQLMVLREAGLVRDRRDGWNIFYRVIKPEIFEIMDAASELLGEGNLTVERRVAYSASSPACPCPKCKPSQEEYTTR